MPDPELKRVLKLPAVVCIAIGFTIGGGVFVFTGIVFKIVGQALPIAYSLAVIPVFISMLPIAMLGSAIPTTGANYMYPSRMVSPGLAFVGIWVYAWASFFGQVPLYAIGCAAYARTLFPSLPPTLFAIALVSFIYIINLLGLKPAARVQGILVIILISALVFYSYSGIGVIDHLNFSKIIKFSPAKLMIGTALLTFTYFGANGIIELGGEIVNPGKVIPAAFFIAMPLVMLLYLAVALATVGAVPAHVLEDAAEPLIRVCQNTAGKTGIFFFTVGGAVLALTTTLNAIFIVGTKSLLIMAQDHLLPTKLGRLNQKFGTPHVFLTIVWILSLLGIVSGFSMETLASYAALGGLIIFLPLQISAVRLPLLYPEQYQTSDFKLKGFWLWFCPVVGVVMVIFFSMIILFDLKSMWKIFGFIAFIISGILYYHLRKNFLFTKGIRLTDLLKKKECRDVR